MEIRVNGQSRRVRDGMVVADLLLEMGASGKRIAVERNGEIVPRSRHTETTLSDGDRIEVVVAVGGG